MSATVHKLKREAWIAVLSDRVHRVTSSLADRVCVCSSNGVLEIRGDGKRVQGTVSFVGHDRPFGDIIDRHLYDRSELVKLVIREQDLVQMIHDHDVYVLAF